MGLQTSTKAENSTKFSKSHLGPMTATSHRVGRMLVFFFWVAPGVSVKQLQESPVTPEGYIVHRVWMGFASNATHLFHDVLVLVTMLKPKLARDIRWETIL